MAHAVVLAKLDDDNDGLLTEANLARWLTVLNHGDEPSTQDMEELLENLDKCRDMQGAPHLRVRSPIARIGRTPP